MACYTFSTWLNTAAIADWGVAPVYDVVHLVGVKWLSIQHAHRVTVCQIHTLCTSLNTVAIADWGIAPVCDVAHCRV